MEAPTSGVIDQDGGSHRSIAWIVGASAIVLASAYAIAVLSQAAWDVTMFTAFGDEAVATRAYAEERLDHLVVRGQLGHDGRFFFVQGNDPWVLEPEVNAAVLDRPLYRSQRMFYPLVASGFGLLGPQGVVWGLLVVNLIAMGAGTWAVAVIASEMGMSPWWGLAFLLNIGLISELNISGAGIVAAAAAFGAVALFLRNRFWWGVGMLVISALSREVMLLVAAGCAFWWWRYQSDRRRAIWTLVIPASAVGLWALYLRLRIGLDSGVGEVDDIFGWPFLGFVRAFEDWKSDSLSLIAGLAVMGVLLVYSRRALTARHLIGYAFVGFVALGVLLASQVWRNYFDITRAIAPLITSFVLLAVAAQHQPTARTSDHPNPDDTDVAEAF